MRGEFLKILTLIILVTRTYASYSWNRSYRRWMPNDESFRRTGNSQPKQVINDMPTQSDLKIYLKALQRVVEFSAAHKNDIDINFALGLFLINVNLKTVMRHRHMNVPTPILQSMRELVKKNTELLNFFHNMAKQDKTIGNSQNKAICSLFLNDTAWLERYDRHDVVFETAKMRSSFSQLRVKYGPWEHYTRRIFDWDKSAVPGPQTSDYCIGSLAESPTGPIDMEDFKPKCVLPEYCVSVIMTGTDSGYALTHRLLLMILALYGRGCCIFSKAMDRTLIDKFCKEAFDEAQYIAKHQYGVKDLLMEEIALCSLEGHVEFLKRSWLANALKHQTPHGCFASLDVRNGKTSRKHAVSKSWKFARRPQDQNLQGGECNSHLTATSAAALAVAVRFILATKYPRHK